LLTSEPKGFKFYLQFNALAKLMSLDVYMEAISADLLMFVRLPNFAFGIHHFIHRLFLGINRTEDRKITLIDFLTNMQVIRLHHICGNS